MPRASFASRKSVWGNPAPPAAKVMTFPAPALGINAVDPMAGMGPQYSTIQTNFVSDGRGLKIREGFQQHCTDVGSEVRTIIPFTGLSSANDALYGATSTGIYDFTSAGAGPWTPEVTFGTTGGNAGWGTNVQYTSDAGTHYGFYADEVNGLFRLSETAGTWAAVTDITGVNETNLTFCMSHKKRMWFVERGTADAWYLGAGNIAGAATKFSFGNKFQHGGTLVGLWNWTIDGGLGIDDYLVAISSAGDVLAYRFTDPSDVTTFEQTAQYYIGDMPEGRRVATQSGGELYILSQYGIIPMSKLVTGRPVQEQDIFASRNISPLLANDMALYRTDRGWDLKAVPSQSLLLLSTPKVTGFPYKQYALSTKTNGWCIFNSLDYLSGDTFGGTFYIGDEDGVNKFTGNEDEVLLADSTGVPITASLITVFADVEAPGHYHQIQFIRPVFRATGNLAYDVDARYDYDTDDFVPALTPASSSGAIWDTALWDTALWGTNGATVDDPRGGAGIGRAIAAAMTVESSASTTFLRMDIILTQGGPL